MMSSTNLLEVTLSHCRRNLLNHTPTGTLESVGFWILTGRVKENTYLPFPLMTPSSVSWVWRPRLPSAVPFGDEKKLSRKNFFLHRKYFLSAVLFRAASRSGPKSRSPEKGTLHRCNLEAVSQAQVFNRIDLLAATEWWILQRM